MLLFFQFFFSQYYGLTTKVDDQLFKIKGKRNEILDHNCQLHI